jgi:hypothetical protein
LLAVLRNTNAVQIHNFVTARGVVLAMHQSPIGINSEKNIANREKSPPFAMILLDQVGVF